MSGNGDDDNSDSDNGNGNGGNGGDPSVVVGGAPPTLAQMGAVVRRWRQRRTELARLQESLAALRAEQRRDDQRIRLFMQAHGRDELPTSAPGPDGRPIHTGTIWLSNPRAAPKPISKQHLADVLHMYTRIDEVTRAHLANYIWEHRQFGPEIIHVHLQDILHHQDTNHDAAASAAADTNHDAAASAAADTNHNNHNNNNKRQRRHFL